MPFFMAFCLGIFTVAVIPAKSGFEMNAFASIPGGMKHGNIPLSLSLGREGVGMKNGIIMKSQRNSGGNYA
jgi:hypothetical protein